jgi:hypothetical protein
MITTFKELEKNAPHLTKILKNKNVSNVSKELNFKDDDVMRANEFIKLLGTPSLDLQLQNFGTYIPIEERIEKFMSGDLAFIGFCEANFVGAKETSAILYEIKEPQPTTNNKKSSVVEIFVFPSTDKDGKLIGKDMDDKDYTAEINAIGRDKLKYAFKNKRIIRLRYDNSGKLCLRIILPKFVPKNDLTLEQREEQLTKELNAKAAAKSGLKKALKGKNINPS